ncbi:MAG TPA: sigma-70 family RNA polymerase sigma factor [Pirellulales bacterium]|jgi:RNA polymerase sigma-70 factor (ECF subfamily)|nr:sigma-70 family RNA polymerase sigma factor [Pirellulales bacterium]
MTESPETRLSLIVRLKDRRDQQAWAEFLEIYGPLVQRLALAKGLQHADAEDVAQQVFGSVAKAVEHWQPDAERARFRTWLTTIARNAIVNALSRRAPDRASGDTAERELLAECAANSAESQLLLVESRREVFQWAARRVQKEFEPSTWDAFWLTAVEGREVAEAAAALNKQPGAVYAARSRVMRRLRQIVLQWHGTE